jgi:hypothetical protein
MNNLDFWQGKKQIHPGKIFVRDEKIPEMPWKNK